MSPGDVVVAARDATRIYPMPAGDVHALRGVHLEFVQAHAIVELGQHAQGHVAARGDVGHHFLDAAAHAGGQRPRRPGQQLRLRGLVQRSPFHLLHASILSTGNTISPRAPARFSSSNRCQVTTPWHSACIASSSPPSGSRKDNRRSR